MSVTFLYQATLARPLKELRAIVAAAKRRDKKRTWANEGFFLVADTGVLSGSTKLFTPTTTRDDLLAAAADAEYLVDLLHGLAREHGLTWRISCPDELGCITSERIDEQVTTFVTSLRELAEASGPAEESRPRTRVAPRPKLLPKKDILALRQRWPTKRLASIQAMLDAADHPALLAACGEHLGRVDLRGIDLKVLTTKDERLADLVLTGCDFSHSQCQYGTMMDYRGFHDCRFDGADIAIGICCGAFSACTFIAASFDESSFSARLVDCDFTHARFDRLRMSGQVVTRCCFAQARMRKSHLSGSRFSACVFTGTDLAGAELDSAAFVQCDLTGAVVLGTWYGDAAIVQGDLTDAVDLGSCYGDTVFKACTGLDAERMSRERYSVCGEFLGDPPIITDDPAHPDEAETVDGMTCQLAYRRETRRESVIDDDMATINSALFPRRRSSPPDDQSPKA